MLLALRVDHADLSLRPDHVARRRLATDETRHLALEVHDQRRVAVHDPPRFRGPFRRVALRGERHLADARRIRAVEPLDEATRQLALGPERGAPRLGVEELLEGAVLLPRLAHAREHLRHPLPDRT